MSSSTEMCISSNYGIHVCINLDIEDMFYEMPGIVLELDRRHCGVIKEGEMSIKLFEDIPHIILGETTKYNSLNGTNFSFQKEELRKWWEYTSYQIERRQMNPKCAKEEYKYLQNPEVPNYLCETLPVISNLPKLPKIAIIREEGSNGDREMAAAFQLANFVVYDIHMNDLLTGVASLYNFRAIAFVGGFSYSDTLGAATGWCSVIKNNKILQDQFRHFYERENSISLGVCNGCQLMVKMKWVGQKDKFKLLENRSGRFESRYSTVCFTNVNCIFTKGMEKDVLPVWVSHKEGRFNFKENFLAFNHVMYYKSPIGYCSNDYPHCPNGSDFGLAGICSNNGRHLAMMPHPERTFLPWQLAYNPLGWETSPWMKLFQNAYNYLTSLNEQS